MKKLKLKVYEYPLKDDEGTYLGSYTIKEDVKPLGFKGERLVDELEITISGINWEKDTQW